MHFLKAKVVNCRRLTALTRLYQNGEPHGISIFGSKRIIQNSTRLIFMALRYAGRIIRTHGTSGQVVIGDCIAHFRGFPPGAVLQVGYSSAFGKPYTVKTSSSHGSGRFAVTLQGVTSPESASTLKEMGVFVEEDLLRAQTATQYFDDEIIGASVVNRDTGEEIGLIKEIWDTPANEIWVVDYNGKELPIPVIDEIVKHVNIKRKQVSIYVMPGLLEIVENTPNDERDDDDDTEKD
ncbi:MAG: 16S rRNA processing protein RimM [Candidatus Kapabacteria bacterium]|nr:16S rRNA processing protein RimM [Candidatus Kapabacteria bacterium]